MSRDEHTLNHVRGTANGIAKSNVLVTSPKEIKPEFFSSKSGRFISVEESRTIQAALKNSNMLDDKLLLVEDPRGSNWREIVKAAVPNLEERDSLVADQSPISELLNFAWDMHEITDDYLPEIFAWFKENRPIE
eukprot:gene24394-30161_t